MPKLSIIDKTGKEVKKLTLSDAVFGIEPNKQAMFDAIVMQQASMRQGTHDTKGRTEVRGGGRKPFRQKGTGRARAGSIRAPQWRGGGIVFGPTPRSYAYSINRKVRRLALRSLLSQKVIDSSLAVMDNIVFEAPKTKEFLGMMNTCKFEGKTLFVVDVAEDWDNAFLACRNLPNALMTTVEGMNALDLANADLLVATEAAIKTIEEVFA